MDYQQQRTVEYTKEQRKAIFQKGNIIVSASAGSGKTTVMIERIFRLINEGVGIDNIFVTTFTRESAIDMQGKLKRKLQNDVDVNNNIDISDVIDRIDTSNIGTFHSICSKIIRTHFYSCGVDPDFILIDEREREYLLNDSISSVIDSFNNSPTKEYLDLARVFLSNRTLKPLKNLIRQVYDFAVAQIFPFKWLEESTSNMLDTTVACEHLEEYKSDKKKRQIEKVYDYISKANERGMNLNEVGQELIDLIENRVQKLAIRMTKKIVNCVNDTDLSLFESYKAFRDNIKKNIEKENEKDFVDSSNCIYYANIIIQLVKATIRHYSDKKFKYGKLDFSDIEHTMLRVLQDDTARTIIQDKIKYVFVDEYQDINPIQDFIICKISHRSETFFVGDVKQSIYGFRMCNPSYFIEKLNDPNNKVINLNGNFRSNKNIIKFINSVFAGTMTDQLGGIDYAATSMLKGGNRVASSKNPVVIKLIQTKQTSDWKDKKFEIYNPLNHSEIIQDDSTTVTEIDSVANYISDLHIKGVALKNIAVLVRNRGNFAYGLTKKLDEIGIIHSFAQKSELLNNSEIVALFNYLKLIDIPNDDIAFVAVLLSPFYSITTSQLESVKLSDWGHSDSFYEKCLLYSNNVNDSLAVTLREFFNNIGIFNNYKYTHTVQELAGSIVAKHKYFVNLYTQDRGSSRSFMLYQYLSKLGSDPNNNDLSKYISTVIENGEQIVSEEVGNGVKIITAHSSKGLEYEYLIVADTNRQFNTSDLNLKVLLHTKGMGMKYCDLDVGKAFSNHVHEYIRLIKKQDLLSEELRLLYVALTRAKTQIAIFGRTSEIDYGTKDIDDATSWFDWLYRGFSKIKCEYIDSDYRMPNVQVLKSQRLYSKDIFNIDKVTSIIDSSIYKYPLKGASTKTTVSRIVYGDIQDDFYTLDLDMFKNKEKVRLDGIRYHSVMEHIDFGIEFELAIENLSKSVDIKGLSLVKIKEAHKKIGEIIGNNKVYKERAFVYNQSGEDSDRLVQGKVDLMILGDKVATIVEYKSSVNMSKKEKKSNMDYYKEQIGIYKKAIGEIMGIVVRGMIYDIRKGEFIEV